jgi:phosphoesterase RecJ-like protein
MTTNSPIQDIVHAIRSRQRFVLSSHSRPDGDSIGSQLAMVYALRALGRRRSPINADPAPPPLMQFPGVPEIRIAPAVRVSSTPRSSWSAATSAAPACPGSTARS